MPRARSKPKVSNQLPLVAHNTSPIEKLSVWYTSYLAKKLSTGESAWPQEEHVDMILTRLQKIGYQWSIEAASVGRFQKFFSREQRSWITNGKNPPRPLPAQLTRKEWLAARQITRLKKEHPDDRRALRHGHQELAVHVAIVCHETHRKLLDKDTPTAVIRYGKRGASMARVKYLDSYSYKNPEVKLPYICPGVLVRYKPVPHFLFTTSRGKELPPIAWDSDLGRQLIGIAVARRITGDEQPGEE